MLLGSRPVACTSRLGQKSTTRRLTAMPPWPRQHVVPLRRAWTRTSCSPASDVRLTVRRWDVPRMLRILPDRRPGQDTRVQNTSVPLRRRPRIASLSQQDQHTECRTVHTAKERKKTPQEEDEQGDPPTTVQFACRPIHKGSMARHVPSHGTFVPNSCVRPALPAYDDAEVSSTQKDEASTSWERGGRQHQ